ncbi:MAG: HPr family phosphocarrier protein [Bacillota bacterium]|nr:HPr family phosphocarrier protein [Bacillota bacterium]
MTEETRVVIGQAEGLHARPAAEFVKLANRFRSTVRLELNGRQADGKSIMAVMALGANHGAEVGLRVEGEDAEEALRALEAFLRGSGA